MTQESAPKVLNALIEALAQASGGCSQLAHHRRDPRYLGLRTYIDMARDLCIAQATFEATKVTMVRTS